MLIFSYNFFPIYKNTRNTKKGFNKKAHERYQDLSEEQKNKKQKYSRKQYKNLSEDEKQRLVEYRKNCIKMRNNKD